MLKDFAKYNMKILSLVLARKILKDLKISIIVLLRIKK